MKTKYTKYLWMIAFIIICKTESIAQVFDSKTTLYSTNNGFSGWYTESVYSPIDSYGDDIYFLMLDNNRVPQVGKVYSDGTTELSPLDAASGYKPADDGHQEFSIGVDKDGYIHITGDLHNYPQAWSSHVPSSYAGSTILYWKSKNPEDITEFEFMGSNVAERIPGTACSYGHFITDRDGELYFSSRTLARTDYYQKGNQGGPGRGLGLYRYNTTTKSWTARGVLCSASDASHPVIAWEESGQNGGSYQQFKSDIWFDTSNRMHLVTGMNTQNGPAQVNSIIYAYSDDGGNTFHRANGTNITLPMRVAPGAQQADVLATNPTASNQHFEQPTVTAAWNNYPVVQYKNGSGFYRYWTGTTWSDPVSSPISTRDKVLYNEHTEQLLFIDIHSGNIFAKTSPTSSNQTYDAGETFRYFDVKTFRTQNILNGISWKSTTGKFEVIQLAGPVVTPTDCNGDIGGTASIDDCGTCSGGNTGVPVNSTCTQDCNGDWGGTAELDDCNVCSGGLTGVIPCDQDPYKGTPHTIPGIIEVEDYDMGANTIAYNDLTTGNTGGELRTDDVDIETSSNGGYNVGWTEAGEWLEYTVNVQQTNDYEFSIEVATEQSGQLHLEMDGISISDVINVSSTGGWQTWSTLIATNPVALTNGEHIIRLVIDQGPLNIEKMEFKIILADDCAGVAGGSATIDACGICSGGTTGITPSSPTTWYEDSDNDGFGDPNTTLEDCNQPTGYVANSTDECPGDQNKQTPGDCGCGVEEGTCQDCANVPFGTASIDACGICSGGTTGITPSSPTTWYEDADNDGFGDPNTTLEDCNQPMGYVANSADECPGDQNKQTPGDCGCGVEEGTCQDCANVPFGTATIDACGICSGGTTGITPSSPTTWYEDADNDGLGDPNSSLDDCDQPTGYVGNSSDLCPNDNTNTCNDPIDCNGEVNGTASIDQCNVCSGGSTGIPIDDCLTSTINMDDPNQIQLYPNPTQNIVHLSKSSHWIVYSSIGKTILEGDGDLIDLSNYQDGVYIIDVQHYRTKVFKN